MKPRHESSLALPLPLQPLLLWQTGGLLAISGMASAWFFWPALATATLIFWLEGRARRPVVLLWLLFCTLGGAYWGHVTATRLADFAAKPLPAWALTGKAIPIEGRISEVKGLVDDRVRLFVDDVRPLNDPTAPPLPGRLAVTRDGAGFDGLEARQGDAVAGATSFSLSGPLPGQTLRAHLKIRPLRSQGLFDPSREAYWPRQGVSAVAYASRGRELFEAVGEGLPGAVRREALRGALVRALDTLHPLPRNVARNPLEPALSAPEGWGVLVALLFGDRRYIGQTDMERFVQAGLAHSLALSGQHLAVVGLAAVAVAMGMGRLHSGLFLRLPRFKLVAVLSVPLALGYVWLGDAPPSLMRAAVMLGLWTVWCLAGRFCGRVDVLVLALLLLVVPDPSLIHDTGLQLSFTAVAGLVLGLPLFVRHHEGDPLFHKPGRMRQLLTLLGGVLVCSVVVHLASTPLVMDVFGRMGPWSVLNVLWLPVLGLWVLPLAFVGLVLLTPSALGLLNTLTLSLADIADPVLVLAMLPCRLLMNGLGWLADAGWLNSVWGVRPHWTAILGTGCLFLALCLLARRKERAPADSPLWPYPAVRRLLVVGSCLLLVGPVVRVVDGLVPAATLRLLDVGQGQAVLVAWRGGERLLLDGGGTLSPRYEVGRDAVAPLLSDNTPLRVGTLALSHPHLDHAAGLVFVARQGRPTRVLVPGGLEPLASQSATGADAPDTRVAGAASHAANWLASLRRAEPRADWRELVAGDEVPLGGTLVLEVLHPPAGRVVRGNDGLIVRLVRLEKAARPHEAEPVRTGLALFAGDAPAGVLRQLVASGRDVRAEVLVAPHHASDANFVPAFIEAVAPHEVWASLGWDNRFGFPGRRLVAYLAERGIPLHTTAREGTLEKRW